MKRWVLPAALGGLFTTAAIAGGPGPEEPGAAVWRAECGSCHVPYPPRLLPARSWHGVMAGLDRHFGVDATLDPATAREIVRFLERHAGPDRGGPLVLRVTEAPRFRHEHGGLPDAVWRNPTVKSPTNCAACHRGAGEGRFDEHEARLPR